jgi:hypothetical protein
MGALLKYITRSHKDQIPLIFQARAVKIEPDDVDFLEDVDIRKLDATLGEFDWSGSPMPAAFAGSFFQYLETQVTLRLLVIDHLKLAFSPKKFLGQLAAFMHKVRLSGIDLSGPFPVNHLATFLQGLNKAGWIRRLCVCRAKAGDEIAGALADLIPTLDRLVEVKADNLHPSKAVFVRLWRAIASHPFLRANDFPTEDCAFLKASRSSFMQALKCNTAEFLARPVPSSATQRADFTIAQLQNCDDSEFFTGATGVQSRKDEPGGEAAVEGGGEEDSPSDPPERPKRSSSRKEPQDDDDARRPSKPKEANATKWRGLPPPMPGKAPPKPRPAPPPAAKPKPEPEPAPKLKQKPSTPFIPKKRPRCGSEEALRTPKRYTRRTGTSDSESEDS